MDYAPKSSSVISADLFGNSNSSSLGAISMTTAEFIQAHMAQPSNIEPAVFTESQGFATKEQVENLDQRR